MALLVPNLNQVFNRFLLGFFNPDKILRPSLNCALEFEICMRNYGAKIENAI